MTKTERMIIAGFIFFILFSFIGGVIMQDIFKHAQKMKELELEYKQSKKAKW